MTTQGVDRTRTFSDMWSLARWGIDDITLERALERVCRELAVGLPTTVLPGRIGLGDALQESGACHMRVIGAYRTRVRRRLGADGVDFLAQCAECEADCDSGSDSDSGSACAVPEA